MATYTRFFGRGGIDEFVEAGLDERASHFAGAVGAEVEEDHGVVIADHAEARLRRRRLW